MKLAVVELYNPLMHGNEPGMRKKYLVDYEITLEEFFNCEHEEILECMEDHYKYDCSPNKLTDDVYDNYENIVNNDKYYQIQIVEPFMENDTMGCILKTYPISILQRKWKNYMNSRTPAIVGK